MHRNKDSNENTASKGDSTDKKIIRKSPSQKLTEKLKNIINSTDNYPFF